MKLKNLNRLPKSQRCDPSCIGWFVCGETGVPQCCDVCANSGSGVEDADAAEAHRAHVRGFVRSLSPAQREAYRALFVGPSL